MLSSAKALFRFLLQAMRPAPPAPVEDPRDKLAPEALRFSDLALDDPTDALRALRRASRTPPHQRHLDEPVEDRLSMYSLHFEAPQARAPQPDLKLVEKKRRDRGAPAAPREDDKKTSSAA